MEVTCNVQINYPTAEAALEGRGGTVGQFGYSLETQGVPQDQLEATLQTLAAAAGAHAAAAAAKGRL